MSWVGLLDETADYYEARRTATLVPMACRGLTDGLLFAGVFASLLVAVYPVVVLSILLGKAGKAAFGPARAADDGEEERRG